jgi:hypothetical protein
MDIKDFTSTVHDLALSLETGSISAERSMQTARLLRLLFLYACQADNLAMVNGSARLSKMFISEEFSKKFSSVFFDLKIN